MLTDEYTELKPQLDRIEKNVLLAAKNVLDIDEVCLITGMSKSHIYKLTAKQLIPHYKPNGKNIYFKKEEIENWLLQNRISTKDEIDQQAINYVTTHK